MCHRQSVSYTNMIHACHPECHIVYLRHHTDAGVTASICVLSPLRNLESSRVPERLLIWPWYGPTMVWYGMACYGMAPQWYSMVWSQLPLGKTWTPSGVRHSKQGDARVRALTKVFQNHLNNLSTLETHPTYQFVGYKSLQIKRIW